MKSKPFITVLGMLLVTDASAPAQTNLVSQNTNSAALNTNSTSQYPSREDVIQTIFKNQQIFDAVMSSPQVNIQRLHQRPGLFKGYDKDPPVALSPDLATYLKQALADPSSYGWDQGVGCIPEYGVLFNFQSGGQTVHIYICFKCNMMAVTAGDGDKPQVISDGDVIVLLRWPLMVIAKKTFPNDKEIQALQYSTN